MRSGVHWQGADIRIACGVAAQHALVHTAVPGVACWIEGTEAQSDMPMHDSQHALE